MRKLIKSIVALLGLCLGLGVAVSKIEKSKNQKGWVDRHRPYGFYERELKRPLDFGFALFAMIILGPVMVVTAIFVRLKMGSPVLFTQWRPGLGERVFGIVKFRTMTNECNVHGELLPDHDRITSLGTFLRKSSIDELPELINIIRGDMSLIGPRPLLTEYLPYYSEKERHRHDVRPGLSGLAQINGRNRLNWDERLQYDVKYVDHITFWQDVQVVFKTLINVFRSRDAVADAETVESWLNEERNIRKE